MLEPYDARVLFIYNLPLMKMQQPQNVWYLTFFALIIQIQSY